MELDIQPVKFIAEVSSNHHQDLKRCLSFIDSAAEIGCYSVKFQLFKVSDLFAPEILTKSKRHRDRKQWELPDEFIPKIAERCQYKNIKFSCTPFSLEAVDILEPYVDFLKISSYELLWDGLLASCAQTGKPVILSTGMATLEEVDHAVSCLKENGCESLTILHCVSAYPVKGRECNLAAIETLRQRYNLPIGWSDHSVSPAVINRAVHHWGASLIEFHLDLDKTGEEFSAGHCWLPEQMKMVIAGVNDALEADGDGIKKPSPSEATDREWRADPTDGLRPRIPLRK